MKNGLPVDSCTCALVPLFTYALLHLCTQSVPNISYLFIKISLNSQKRITSYSMNNIIRAEGLFSQKDEHLKNDFSTIQL